jgi:hypothetical protein
VDWAAYLAVLSALERPRAEALAEEYGEEAANRRVRYHATNSLDELEDALRKDNQRVRTQVIGLYESIDVRQCPVGWTIANNLTTEADGTRVVQTDVIGPNGATGFFERGYNATQQRIELRNAFLRLAGATEALPAWVTGLDIPMVAGRGTPTVQYFTFYQFKLLGVPAGQIRWWRRLLHWVRLRSGPFATLGLVTSIKMSTIQNLDTIVHLHWLRQQFPATDLNGLVAHTSSVEYAETTAVQCGYQIAAIEYVAGGEWEDAINVLLNYFEIGNPQRMADNDKLLARYSFNRHTVMRQNFDIELSVFPGQVE